MTSRSISLLHAELLGTISTEGMEEKAQNLGHLPQLVLVPPPPPPCTGPLCFQNLTNFARGT